VKKTNTTISIYLVWTNMSYIRGRYKFSNSLWNEWYKDVTRN